MKEKEPSRSTDQKTRQGSFWNGSRPVKNWVWLLFVLVAVGAVGLTASYVYQGQYGALPKTLLVQESYMDFGDYAAPMATRSSAPNLLTGTANGQEQRIMYSAQMQVETADIDPVEGQLRNLTSELGGYVLESRAWSSYEQPFLRLSVRIPVTRFEEALASFGEIGDVKEQSVQGQDVTQEYLDTSARLRNKQEQERRYLELLDDAQTVEEVLSVERELERIRVEIESMQGRIQFLESRTDYASITITVTEPVEPQLAGISWNLLWRDMLQTLMNSLQSLLLFASVALPWVIALLIIVWLITRRRR